MDAVPQANAMPPIPDPAELIPLAILRLRANHCDKMAVLGMIINPISQPTKAPWER
jgi:hypothetical protein